MLIHLRFIKLDVGPNDTFPVFNLGNLDDIHSISRDNITQYFPIHIYLLKMAHLRFSARGQWL